MWAFLNLLLHSLFRLVEEKKRLFYAFPICFLFSFFNQTYTTSLRISFFNKIFSLFLFFVFPIGGYDKEEKAARAYDLAALKYWGTTTTTNFPVSFTIVPPLKMNTYIYIDKIIHNAVSLKMFAIRGIHYYDE